MRHADFGLAGKFDFAVSGEAPRKSLHASYLYKQKILLIYISKKILL